MAFQPNWAELQPENKWRILPHQKRFALWALYTSIGSMMLGFDFGVAGTATAFTAFEKQFGVPYPKEASGYLVPARWQSGWAGASSAGAIVGELLAGQMMDIIGRKHMIGFGSVVTAVGIAMQVASTEWRLFLAGRFINAIGFGTVFVQCPVWIGENVRPELRGFFLCIINASIVLGQFILSVVARGSSHIEGKWSYELLIVLQFAFVGSLLLLYPFFPESPYYLFKKGKKEQALKSLNRIHGIGDQGLIDAEMIRLEKTVLVSEELRVLANQDGPGWLRCFKGTNLKRTIIACLLPAGQQLIGSAFVLGYVTYFLDLIGIADYFTVSVILYVIMLLSNVCAFFFVEYAGRRALIVPGTMILTAILLLMGICGAVKTPGAVWVVVVCIFAWAVVYQLTIGAVGFALGSEIATPSLRPYTQALLGLTQGVFGWTLAFTTPYMINPDAGNLGGKVGFVFAGLGLFVAIACFFLVPETKGMMFDEIDYLFNNKVSPRRFQAAIKVHREQHPGATSADLGKVHEFAHIEDQSATKDLSTVTPSAV